MKKNKNNKLSANNKNHSEAELTTLVKARKWFLIISLSTLALLFIFDLIFKPEAPNRPFLIQSLEKEELLRGINWYADNSTGSLGLPDSDKCTIYLESKENNCEVLIKDKISNLFKELPDLLQEKKSWKDVWHPGSPAPTDAFSFSLYSYEFLDQVSIKKEPSPLNDQTRLTLIVNRTDLSPFLNQIISKYPENINNDNVNKLKSKLNKKEEINIYIRKHPMGYYLTVPALPDILK